MLATCFVWYIQSVLILRILVNEKLLEWKKKSMDE